MVLECPFTFVSLWMPLALLVISLAFSALISILYLVKVLWRLSPRVSSSCSANRRLVIFLPPMLTFPSCSSRGWSGGVKVLGKLPVPGRPTWPGRVAQSVGHPTRKSWVLGSISGLATYFRFSFRFFKKGSCQLLA